MHALAEFRHYLTAPVPDTETTRTTKGVSQAEFGGTWFHSLDRNARNRLFLVGGAGTSFGDHPLATEQFTLGGPFRLSAFDIGEKRGDNFMLVTGGYLRGVGRLPDFIGGPLLVGGWIEEGSAFDELDKAQYDTNVSVGAIADTLIGPVFLGASVAFDGSSRFYIGIGRIFH
jgi:NTE family protein